MSEDELNLWVKCTGPAGLVPATEDPVLVCTITKKGVKTIKVGYYILDRHMWVVGMNSNVIAWMELPDPPEWEE